MTAFQWIMASVGVATLLVTSVHLVWSLWMSRHLLVLRWDHEPKLWTLDFEFGYVRGIAQRVPAEPYGLALLQLAVVNKSTRPNTICEIRVDVGGRPIEHLTPDEAAWFAKQLGEQAEVWWPAEPDLPIDGNRRARGAVAVRSRRPPGQAWPVVVTVVDHSDREYSIRAFVSSGPPRE